MDKNKWIILKFGGSSISKIGFSSIMRRINELLKNNTNRKIVIVLSAMKNTTNLLLKGNIKDALDINIELAKRLNLNESVINKLIKISSNHKNMRESVSIGELLSTTIFYEFVKHKNNALLNVELLDSKYFIKSLGEYENTEDIYLSSEYYADYQKFSDLLSEKNVYICQGFIGSTLNNNEVCLIGRGGSDTTASLIANMLDAESIEIWTDVNGMYTADPNKIKNSKIINKIGYDEAQELAAMGAKVLHPYCIIPCKSKNIPMFIRNTYDFDALNYTKIFNKKNTNKEIYAITDQNNITVFNIESINMWNNYGFVYDIFKKFSKLGIDVNIITTSQFTISTTTDCQNKKLLNKVCELLKKNYKVEMITDCSIISIVGDSIKNQDGIYEAMNIIKKYDIHIIHHSANDLTISYVVNNSDSLDILIKLHQNLISSKCYQEDLVKVSKKWWFKNLEEIKQIMNINESLYLYNLEFVKNQIDILKLELPSIDQIFYSMKANNNENVIKKIASQNIGFECVSLNEVYFLRNTLNLQNNIIFTPNFCNLDEYKEALKIENINVIVDNIDIIINNLDIFKNNSIGIRIDLNSGEGHHMKVITEGKLAKFGSTIFEVINSVDTLKSNNINVIGLHSHRGSGIQNYKSWVNTADSLIEISKKFNNIKWIDLGGGFGVDNDNPIDFIKLNDHLNKLKKDTKIKFYIEPGRFIVSEAGILLSKVTQVKEKQDIKYIGLNTGMNSLMRPSLYDSFHKIHNISKLGDNNLIKYNIVGPICESGDVLGKNRLLPLTEVNDVFLIENSGAYGFVMSNNYNMRNPAKEMEVNY
jgi:diaminopimelate decarboxylase/aspartate kinase